MAKKSDRYGRESCGIEPPCSGVQGVVGKDCCGDEVQWLGNKDGDARPFRQEPDLEHCNAQDHGSDDVADHEDDGGDAADRR